MHHSMMLFRRQPVSVHIMTTGAAYPLSMCSQVSIALMAIKNHDMHGTGCVQINFFMGVFAAMTLPALNVAAGESKSRQCCRCQQAWPARYDTWLLIRRRKA